MRLEDYWPWPALMALHHIYQMSLFSQRLLIGRDEIDWQQQSRQLSRVCCRDGRMQLKQQGDFITCTLYNPSETEKTGTSATLKIGVSWFTQWRSMLSVLFLTFFFSEQTPAFTSYCTFPCKVLGKAGGALPPVVLSSPRNTVWAMQDEIRLNTWMTNKCIAKGELIQRLYDMCPYDK